MGYEIRFSETFSFEKGASMLAGERAIQRMEPFFSSLTGIINYYYLSEGNPGEPPLFLSSARLCRLSSYLGISFDPSVGGIGETPSQAFLSACGEALERYGASIVPKRKLVMASYEELKASGKNVLDPALFQLFAEWQYKEEKFAYDPFEKESIVGWIEGDFLLSEEKVWIPAAFVYLPYFYEYGKESRINHTTSTGLAFHFVPEKAWITGLCEVVERDAFTITWWTKMTPDELDLDSVEDGRIRSLLDGKLSTWKRKIKVFCLPTDTRFPVFLGLFEDEAGEEPNKVALCVGAASALTVEEALYKVIIEVVQTWKYAAYLKQQNERKEQKKVFYGNWDEEIRDFSDGVLCYSYPNFRSHVDFLKGGKKIYYQDIKKEYGFHSLQEAVQDLSRLGFKPVVIDITPEDIRSGGGYVSRVVVPGMVSLNGAHRYRFWGGKRIYTLPQSLGKCDHILTWEGLNPYPHPFP